MCRNIKTLFNFEPPATEDEIEAASLQFVRKLSGFNAPSKANPNRTTCQQRKTRAAAPSTPRPRRLRFGYTRAHPPNPAESRELLNLFLDEGPNSPQQQTDWRWMQARANLSSRPIP